jgi:O-antigen/teichoic acid export membrane protein
MVPLAVGLAAVAAALARAIFDPAWYDVAPMLILLSVLAVPRPITGAITAYFYSVDRPMTVLWLEWFNVIVLFCGMVALGTMGPLWACVAVGIAFSVRALAAMLIVGRAEGVAVQNFLTGLVRPLAASVPMVAAVLAVDAGVGSYGTDHPVVVLLMECALGALVYVGAALLIARDTALDLVHLCRGMLVSNRAPALPPA